LFKKNLIKKILPVAVLSSLAFSSLVEAGTANAKSEKTAKNNLEIKNVIFLIGDGMGVSYTSAYRYLNGFSICSYGNGRWYKNL
jgi:alkaline phosphatase